ncbi:MAG: branched-chain amino acid ABC transporter permease [Proteobacteria bacterium]|nr:branched-chain amino acid ABC transporter permease [Pseudomonadota bacterium]
MEGGLSFLIFFLIFASFYSLSSLGLNLQWGFTGLFNVGIVGFFAIGAYTSAILTGPPYADTLFGGFGLWFPLGFVGAMVTSGVAAFIVGFVTLRLREDFLAISTFGIAVSIQLVALNFESLTRGPNGMYSLPRPLAGYFDSSTLDNLLYLIMCLLIIAGVYWAFERMVRSPWGRVLRSIRDDEIAAAALGKNVFAVRLQSFVVGSAVMGLAGALYANFIGFISPLDFIPIFTFQVFVMLIVGGSGNNLGALLGGLVVWGLWSGSDQLIASILPPTIQTQAAAARIVLIGFVLAVMLLYRPEGILRERRIVSREARLPNRE